MSSSYTDHSIRRRVYVSDSIAFPAGGEGQRGPYSEDLKGPAHPPAESERTYVEMRVLIKAPSGSSNQSRYDTSECFEWLPYDP